MNFFYVMFLRLVHGSVLDQFNMFQKTYNKSYSEDEYIGRFHIFMSNLQIIESHNSNPSSNFWMNVNEFTDLSPFEFKERYVGKTYMSRSSSYGCVSLNYTEYFNKDELSIDLSVDTNYSYSFMDNVLSFQPTGAPTSAPSVAPSVAPSFAPSVSQTNEPMTLILNRVLNTIDSFDWRDYGVVGPVRNQGQCGSCWAFATTANAESVWAIYSGKLYDLSEQYLVDCATGKEYLNMGCQGGNMDSAFKYMIQNKQCSESEYPYVSGVTEHKGPCHTCDEITKFSSCYDVESGNQLAIKSAVLANPVVIGIEADTYYFQSYSGGIIDGVLCGDTIDHAVEIVGFGVDNGTKYWSVRNSWGADWGENGYFRILRTDSTDDPGICGLALEPSYISI